MRRIAEITADITTLIERHHDSISDKLRRIHEIDAELKPIAKRFPDKTAGLSPAELASWEDGYETAKSEVDADYQGDREAFRKHIEETGEEEGVKYLF